MIMMISWCSCGTYGDVVMVVVPVMIMIMMMMIMMMISCSGCGTDGVASSEIFISEAEQKYSTEIS